MTSENARVEPVVSDGKYIHVIVSTILTFIMGQAVESLNDRETYLQTQTVNSNACELMEILLRTMYYDKALSQEITHLIIDPVVNTLRLAIENDNTAQQIQLLQLVKVVLTKCHFWSAKLKNKDDS